MWRWVVRRKAVPERKQRRVAAFLRQIPKVERQLLIPTRPGIRQFPGERRIAEKHIGDAFPFRPRQPRCDKRIPGRQLLGHDHRSPRNENDDNFFALRFHALDEIGVIATHVDEKGFLRFAPLGGVYPLTLFGHRVIFGNGTIGVIGREEKDVKNGEVKMDQLFIDVGARDTASSPVQVGDAACFWRDYADTGERMISKAMDDRIGCAVLIDILRQLGKSPHDLYFVFTVQEEVGLRGATTSTYGVQPDIAVAVDVTDTGDTPESNTMAVALGKGPAIKVKDSGMLAHPALKNLLVQTASEAKMPFQLEVLTAGSTDAAAMQLSREGVPAGVISIATRYVHTPSEMVDYEDVQNAVKLLTTFLSKPIKLD